MTDGLTEDDQSPNGGFFSPNGYFISPDTCFFFDTIQFLSSYWKSDSYLSDTEFE